MSRRILVKLTLLATLLMVQASCGGGSQATATAGTVYLDADVASGTDPKTGQCASFTVKPDDVTVTITALQQKSQSSIQNPIVIDSVDIIYAPANTSSPALATVFAEAPLSVNPGGSGDVTVRVASQELKSGATLSQLVCTGTIYTYFVTLHFHAHDTNGTVNIDDAHLNVRFADFAG